MTFEHQVWYLHFVNEMAGLRGMSAYFQFDIGGASPIEVNVSNKSDLLETVRGRFSERQGFALATINLDHLVKLRTSKVFRDAYAEQDLIVADGNPIVWLSRVASRPVALAPGSDLVVPLARLAAAQGVSVALLGANDSTLAGAAEALCAEIPDLRVVAQLAPSQDFNPFGIEAAQLIEAVRESGAGLTLLALGAPRQEAFAARGLKSLPGVGFVSIGAGLDFLAGSQTRAPRWVRWIAMEWLWRMMSNPKRLALRYLKCALILPSLFIMALRQRRKLT